MYPQKTLSPNPNQDQSKNSNNTEHQSPESYTEPQAAGSANLANETSVPQASASVSAAQSAAQPQQPNKRGKLWRTALIAGLSLLLIGGGTALAYFAYYLPNRPENILKAALANSLSPDGVDSLTFGGEFETKDTSGESQFKGSFSGVTGSEGAIDLEVELDAVITTLSINFRSVDGKKAYAKLSGLSGLQELLASNFDIGEGEVDFYSTLFDGVDGQWFEINESLVEDVSGGVSKPTSSDFSKLADIYDKYPFLEIREVLPDEQINGTDSYHYKIGINKQQLNEFFLDVKDADFEGLDLTDEQIQSLTDNTKYVDAVDVWIAKGTKRFTQFAFTTGEQGTEFAAKLTITAYNEPVEIDEPENAKSILELLGDVFGQEGDVQGETDLLPWLEGELAPRSL